MQRKVTENGITGKILSLFLVLAMAIQLTDQIDFLHTEVSILIIALFLLAYGRIYLCMPINKGLLVLYLLLYGSVITIYKLVGISSANWSYISIYYSWIIYSLIGVYVLNVFSFDRKKFIFYGIYAAVMGNIIYICIYGHMYVNVWSKHVELMANASYSSMITIFTGICFIWMLNDKRKRSRILSVLGVILSLYANVIILQRGTNFVLTILMIALLLLFNSRRQTKGFIIGMVVVIGLLFFFITGIYVNIFNALIGQLDYRLAKKMSQILIYLQTRDIDAAGGFSGRFYLAQTSLRTWTSSVIHFFVGAGDIRGSNTIIGNHSEIIDNFARYGLFIGLITISVLWRQMKDATSMINREKHSALKYQVIIVFMINIIRNILGTTLTGAMSIVLIIFMKLLIAVCIDDEQHEVLGEE